MLPDRPLIMTAKLDAASFEFFDGLRRRHFPPERNFLSAHVTMFHNLPGERLADFEKDLENIAAVNSEINLDFSSVRFLGRGTAIEIDAPELITLRADLAHQWQQYLMPQDRQKFKPHITIQNKTEPNAAKNLYENTRAGWQKRTGSATGLQLWNYLGGPWQLAKEFEFK